MYQQNTVRELYNGVLFSFFLSVLPQHVGGLLTLSGSHKYV